MRLSDLLKGLIKVPPSLAGIEIEGVTPDSREVQAGYLFVAVTGSKEDGHRYIQEAVRRGASCVVVRDPQRGVSIPEVCVKDPGDLLPELAARFYGDVSRDLRVIGVTGTNGKTTLTYLIESILKEAGRSVGVIGTVNYRYAGRTFVGANTTPGSVELQRLLHDMKEAGVTDVVMEVSSHALAQGRVRGIHFDGAVFTNLSRDHLDYHRDMEEYFHAKELLFTDHLPASCKKEKFAVINQIDPKGGEIRIAPSVRKIAIGFDKGLQIWVQGYDLSGEGIRATLVVEGRPFEIRSKLLGRFNLENIMAGVAAAHACGIPFPLIASGIEKVESLPGRLERIPNNRGIHIYVDYAHTPDAIAGVGKTLRQFLKGRLITLFGCGGDRDPGKRPEMGREAARASDIVIVTSDNPRTEDPRRILEAILPGLAQAGFPPDRIYRIVDRREAIRKGLELARPGDTLLIAGKGHEDYQIVGEKKIPFSDQRVVKELLSNEAHPT